MKKAFTILLGLGILACPLSALADATSGQKQTTANTLDKYLKTLGAKDISKELCDAVMRSPKAKARMCEILAQDPEARKMLRLP